MSEYLKIYYNLPKETQQETQPYCVNTESKYWHWIAMILLILYITLFAWVVSRWTNEHVEIWKVEVLK